jgi:hypothetical protein
MRISTRISNIGYTKGSNISIRFFNTSGVAVSGLSSLSIAELDSGSALDADITYRMVGNATISEGFYKMPVLVSYTSDQNITYSKTLNLTSSIVVNKPNVIVRLSNPQPQSLYLGRNQSATMEIENIGTGSAKNVSVTLRSSPCITLLSSISSFFINDLASGEISTEPVLISANGAVGCSLNADISYYPSSYQSLISKTQVLNLSIAPAAQFSVLAQTSTSASGPGATAVPVTFRIQNTGTSEAEQIQLSLQTTYPVTPVASTAYLSSLKPGDIAEATFIVSIDSQGVPGNYPIMIYEQWKQPNGAVNQQFSGSNTYFVHVMSAASNNLLIVGVLVVVAVVAAAAYKYTKKMKKVQKK